LIVLSFRQENLSDLDAKSQESNIKNDGIIGIIKDAIAKDIFQSIESFIYYNGKY